MRRFSLFAALSFACALFVMPLMVAASSAGYSIQTYERFALFQVDDDRTFVTVAIDKALDIALKTDAILPDAGSADGLRSYPTGAESQLSYVEWKQSIDSPRALTTIGIDASVRLVG